MSVEEVTNRSFKATKRMYLNADKSAVVDESEGAFLLAGVGQEVSAEDVERYGLLNEPEIAPEPEPPAPPIEEPKKEVSTISTEAGFAPSGARRGAKKGK